MDILKHDIKKINISCVFIKWLEDCELINKTYKKSLKYNKCYNIYLAN